MGAKLLEGKKVLMVIARQSFRDEELAEPRQVLGTAGAAVTIGCRSIQKSVGMLGKVRVTPDVALDQVKGGDYEAVLYVGGRGSTEYWDDAAAQRIAREAHEAGKVVGAICLAVATLARAGLLKGRKTTAYSGAMKACLEGGCQWTGADVQVDGRIVTADGPLSAAKFGKVVRDILAER